MQQTLSVIAGERTWELTLTNFARDEMVKKLVLRDEVSPLRLGVKGGGCSGFSYHVEWETNTIKPDRDLVFSFEGLQIVVDKKSIVYLHKTIIDWEKTLAVSGLKLVNPSEVSRCGCGSSFQVG